MIFVAQCPEGPDQDGIDGYREGQHQWVEAEPYEAQGPVGAAPVRHEPLVCERCGAVEYMWRRIAGPSGVLP